MKDEKKVILAYLAVCFFWGSTYLAIRIGVKDMPPMIFASIRFLVAGSIMLIYCKYKGLKISTDITDIKNLSIVGLLLLLGGNGLVVYAEQWIHSGIASLIVAMVPIYMTIIESINHRKIIIDIKGILGLMLGFSGVLYLVLGNLDEVGFEIPGILMVVTASILWAIGSIYSKSFKTKGNMVGNIGIQMLAGGIGLFIVSLIRGELLNLTFSVTSLWAMAYLIVFGSIVGYSSYIYILQHLPATKASTYTYINPIVAVGLGALILKEPITYKILISASIILVGVFLVQSSKDKTIKKEREVLREKFN